MCLWVSNKKKLWIFYFSIFVSFKSLKKGVGSGVGSGSISQRYGSGYPDPHQNVTDPQHWFLSTRRPCTVPGIPVPEEHGAVLTPGNDVAVGGDVALRPKQRPGHDSELENFEGSGLDNVNKSTRFTLSTLEQTRIRKKGLTEDWGVHRVHNPNRGDSL